MGVGGRELNLQVLRAGKLIEAYVKNDHVQQYFLDYFGVIHVATPQEIEMENQLAYAMRSNPELRELVQSNAPVVQVFSCWQGGLQASRNPQNSVNFVRVVPQIPVENSSPGFNFNLSENIKNFFYQSGEWFTGLVSNLFGSSAVPQADAPIDDHIENIDSWSDNHWAWAHLLSASLVDLCTTVNNYIDDYCWLSGGDNDSNIPEE